MGRRFRVLFPIVLVSLFAVACGQTDAGITTTVKARMADDELVKARNIDVDTSEGVVTLTGEVASADEKSRAVEIARATEGVRDVVDNLSIGTETAEADAPGFPDRPMTRGVGTTGEPAAGDFGITSAVKASLAADDRVSALRIDVDTSEGVVTLTGTVSNAGERDRAVQLAREVEGVSRVIDNLTIR